MADFHDKILLGRTGLAVGRLGVSGGYGASAKALEEAFARGSNYFYWGSRRTEAMAEAIGNIAKGKRDELIVVVQSYARVGFVVKRSVEKALAKAGLEHADVLLLGWFNDPPPPRIIDAAEELRARGRVRQIAISSHRRTMFPELLADQRYGIWHLRYNAVHRGAERDAFPALDGLDVDRRPGVVTYTTTRWGHLVDPKRTPQGEKTPTGTDCYRFSMSHPHVDVAMAGPANDAEMKQALDAVDLGPMSDEELAWMRRVGDHIYGKDRTSGIRDGS